MAKISLGIVSQTPLIRFLKEMPRTKVKLSSLDPGDYVYTVGGVAPMVKSQLDEMLKQGIVSRSIWFSLNPKAPAQVEVSEKMKLMNLSLEEEYSRNYVSFKEKIWNNIHGINSESFSTEEYLGYFKYNSHLASTVIEHSQVELFELHDFQQLLLGSMLGPSFPSIFRWHIPFLPEILSHKVRKFIINGMEGNDAVIVSTRRDLEGLVRAGFKGRAYQVYPSINPLAWKRPSRVEIAELNEKYGIRDEDFVVNNVARMDPMKSQDALIKAVAGLKNADIKLMLIGNGSFTSSKGGLSHGKGNLWRKKLERLVKRLKLEKKVIFTGYMPSKLLRAAYRRSDAFVLPSVREGFGLSVVEAWMYGVPSVVSTGAGVSELIIDGLDGLTFNSGDISELKASLLKLYSDERLRKELGENGRRVARTCFTTTAIPTVKRIYEETISGFKQ